MLFKNWRNNNTMYGWPAPSMQDIQICYMHSHTHTHTPHTPHTHHTHTTHTQTPHHTTPHHTTPYTHTPHTPHTHIHTHTHTHTPIHTHPYSLDPNIKTVVYSAGIALGTEDDWNFMWNKFLTETDPYEKRLYISALAKSTQPWILNRYNLKLWIYKRASVLKVQCSYGTLVHYHLWINKVTQANV